MTVILTRSDDVNIPVTLKTDGVVDDVSAASDITAALTSRDGNTQYGVQAQSSSTTGADWTNGVVVVLFAAAQTGTIPAGGIRLEIQVTLASVKSTYYFDGIESRIGTIA